MPGHMDKGTKNYRNMMKKMEGMNSMSPDNIESIIKGDPNLEKMKYKHDLERFVFVLCPWGNGFDTHRIWETLYSGSIPVIKKHKTFEYLEDLPALFIDNYEDLYNY